MATINRLGQSYAWGDVKVSVFGRELVGITSVEYDKEKEVKAIYGQGVDPVAYGKGNNKYSGKITLDLKEVQGIMKAIGVPGKDITDIPAFDIIVTTGDDIANETIVDVLQECLFTKIGKTIKQNDQEWMVELPLHVSGIVFGS
ncbi:MAG: hypothetical protein K1X92_08950 [Bacteroidia bacterium]|nr:hypothetical protein [Bacteroidia bacterium]